MQVQKHVSNQDATTEQAACPPSDVPVNSEEKITAAAVTAAAAAVAVLRSGCLQLRCDQLTGCTCQRYCQLCCRA
jgi:hypothetical protein